MKNQSITYVLKDNIKEILMQSQSAMSITEIDRFLKLRNIGNYNRTHLHGALHQIVKLEEFESPSRGLYLYTGDISFPDSNICDKLYNLYNGTVNNAKYILNTFDIANASDEEINDIMKLREVIDKTNKLLHEIDKCKI